MNYKKAKILHDDLLHLEGVSELLATSDRCVGWAAEDAFLLIAGEIKRIRIALFESIGEIEAQE